MSSTIYLHPDMPDVQQKIDNAPEGAMIVFAAGVYEDLRISPKRGHSLCGEVTYRHMMPNITEEQSLKMAILRNPRFIYREVLGETLQDFRIESKDGLNAVFALMQYCHCVQASDTPAR